MPRSSRHAAWVLLLVAPSAHASGDPAIIYLLAGTILVHLGLAAVLVWNGAFRGLRIPAVAIYSLLLFALWAWAWNSVSSARLIAAVLILTPVAVLFALRSFAVSRRSR